jgi:molybdate transport system permease protein
LKNTDSLSWSALPPDRLFSLSVFEISPTEWTAILLSLRVATVATLVATPIAVATAWLLARREFWGKALLDAAIHLPLVLPPVVTGYLLLLTFGRRGAVGAWLAEHLGLVFAFRWTGAALACGIMSFPLLVRPIRLSIEAVDRRLEQAASTLGAAPWQVFLTVTLPLALSGVFAGMVLGFAKALGEFGATITFVSNIPGETQTISSAIYALIQTPDGDAAALRLVVVSVLMAMAALVASEWFARRATLRLHGN